jgi:hypothetical protein
MVNSGRGGVNDAPARCAAAQPQGHGHPLPDSSNRRSNPDTDQRDTDAASPLPATGARGGPEATTGRRSTTRTAPAAASAGLPALHRLPSAMPGPGRARSGRRSCTGAAGSASRPGPSPSACLSIHAWRSCPDGPGAQAAWGHSPALPRRAAASPPRPPHAAGRSLSRPCVSPEARGSPRAASMAGPWRKRGNPAGSGRGAV